MEGRWARLAIAACSRGALDFSKISRHDSASLFVEDLVLDEIERAREADLFLAHMRLPEARSTNAMKYMEGLLGEAQKRLLPWNDRVSVEDTIKQCSEEKLKDMYEKLTGQKVTPDDVE